MQRRALVYLDYAAATPVDSRVCLAMQSYFNKEYGNPSALYSLGRQAQEAVDNSRALIAGVLNCRAAEVIFTSNGTESNNLAIFGIARQNYSNNLNGSGRGHLLTTNFEHPAVLQPIKELEQEGFTVAYLPVDQEGKVQTEQLQAALQPETRLVSVMYANNEIGTIAPIADLARVLKEKKKAWGRGPNEPPFFHTDACQAAGYLNLDVKKLGIDLMTFSGSKIYGPKGIGCLYVRQGVRLRPLFYGGGQEFQLRAGTENVPGIVGLARALELAQKECAQETARLIPLRDKLAQGLQERVAGLIPNGSFTERLPNNVNVSLLDIEGEAMLLYLDEYGICASAGSACKVKQSSASHVLLSLGRSPQLARASVRFTLGRETSLKEIVYVLEVFPELVGKLRKLAH